jgi:hypothetical protein
MRVVLGMSDLLTDAEHRVMGLTAEVWNTLVREVVGNGPARDGDLAELATDIHRIQERVLAQAAARAYPDRYRLLGGYHPSEVRAEAERGQVSWEIDVVP